MVNSNAIANNSNLLLLDWGWLLQSFYSIYVPKPEVEIYKTTQLLMEFWEGKAAEVEFFLKINNSVVCDRSSEQGQSKGTRRTRKCWFKLLFAKFFHCAVSPLGCGWW